MRWALHYHHNLLFEPIKGSIEQRINGIVLWKPREERDLRICLIQEVAAERIPLRLREAWKALDKARVAYRKTWRTTTTDWEARDKAWAAYDKAIATCGEAVAACSPELEALHRELCVPDCPWDGRTIFPGGSQ